MAGNPSGGQALTPNPNSVAGAPMAQVYVNGFAQSNFNTAQPTDGLVVSPPGVTYVPTLAVAQPVAGWGGNQWGAYGGDSTPIGNGVTGVKGWDERVAATVSDGQTDANFQLNNPAAKGSPQLPVLQQENIGAISTLAFDDALPTGGNNQG